MTRVGFLLNFPLEYKGGINYLNNLFNAVALAGSQEVKIVLFVPNKIGKEYTDLFSSVEIIQTSILRRKSIFWFVDKVFEKLLRYNPLTELLLKRNRINVISHSNIVVQDKSIMNVNWIPDFQYKHYPSLWSEKQLADTIKLNSYLIYNSERIILSSHDAFNDLKEDYPELVDKVRVMHFVSQPFHALDSIDLEQSRDQIVKYTNNSRYFYLPNQFWSHKNHSTVFEACKILKERGYDFRLITSGFMEDFRNSDHINKLVDYVKLNDLQDVIKFLGLIPYEHVFSLNLFSLALINPSYFEGWSSTVEEAKTIGTKVILSDINVHREQNPQGAFYFEANNVTELVFQMEKVLSTNESVDKNLINLHHKLVSDTIAFGNEYVRIIKEVIF